MNRSHLLLQACVSTIFFACPASADEVADFYKGKSIEMHIAYTAGGGYDIYARILSRHMGNHIRASRLSYQGITRVPAA
jgi:tripartite-type tricarboxylate transporter receptor subunit TctC